MDTGLGSVTSLIRAGNPVIAVGLRLPVEKLTPGAYTAEVTAQDSLNNRKIRVTEFEIE